MSEPTADFFDRLGRDEAELVPRKYRGSLRFDVRRGSATERWVLIFDEGRVRVLREDQEADCIVRTDKELFDRLTQGRDGIYATMLRNRISVEGDLTLLTPLRELLPGPPQAHHPRRRGQRA